MRKIILTWGQDTPAYAVQDLMVPDDATPEKMLELAREQADNVGDLVFDPSYDWSGLRLVAAVEFIDGKQVYHAEDVPIDVSPEDLGIVWLGALRGRVPVGALFPEAERQNIDVSPDVERALRLADRIVTQEKDLTIPAFCETRTLVLEAFACDEYGDGPAYAEISLTPGLVKEMVRLAAIGKAAGMRVVHVDASDGIWGGDDDAFRMRGTDMVVMPSVHGSMGESSVYWQGHPKHADYNCETRSFDLKDLLACLAGEPVEERGFAEQDGVLFWDGNNGGEQDLIEAYFDDHPEAESKPDAPQDPLGDWVIYHAGEPVDARFWSDKDGWTGLDGATRYVDMPTAPYPMGGPENTQAGALWIGTMRPYTVMLRDTEDGGNGSIHFECFAESIEHAIEQSQNAYPGNLGVQAVQLTEKMEG